MGTPLIAGLLLLAAAFTALADSAQSPARDLRQDLGWTFHREPVPTPLPADLTRLDESSWEAVDLPHAAAVENLVVSHPFLGVCWYRKTIEPAAWMSGKRVTLEFEAGMQLADVWVNGEHWLTHEGGYLPFTVDLTRDFAAGKPAVVTVRLDNRDNADIPPGRPLAVLDFCYFSGLYRNVILHVTDPLHITDAVEANETAGGGIFVRYENVSENSATIDLDVELRNDDAAPRTVRLDSTMRDAEGRAVLHDVSPAFTLQPGTTRTISRKLTVAHPHLWSPARPYLYTLAENAGGVDEVRQRIGIRTLRNDPKLGFFLNGKHLVPSGANRHQAYPYLGNALSDAAQYRDARKLKEAGWDLIRLSHYPQSPAFLDACDELGMMVIECIPGWQNFTETERFKNNVRHDLESTIRRDRNHACAVLWETTLNETNGHDAFFHELTLLAHREYPGDQMLTCGDAEGHDPRVIGYEVPYTGWDGKTRTRPSRRGADMGLHREYGDNEFSGSSRVSRDDGEKRLLIQAWNYQTALNRELGLAWTWGQCAWEAIDNNHGAGPNISRCGVMDLFRLPKFTYYFYASQRDPAVIDPRFDSGPMVFIANYWTAGSPRDVIVYSNAEEVELFVNGRSVGRQRPDAGPDIPFNDKAAFDLNYWQKNKGFVAQGRSKLESPIFNGGNCGKLAHPPFTFHDVAFQPGELKAIAYLGGKSAAQAERQTAGAPAAVKVYADLAGRDWIADGADAIFVHAQVQDAKGNTCWTSSAPVTFAASGPARIVGPATVKAEAGIATVVVQASPQPGSVTVTATSGGLTQDAWSYSTQSTSSGKL